MVVLDDAKLTGIPLGLHGELGNRDLQEFREMMFPSAPVSTLHTSGFLR